MPPGLRSRQVPSARDSPSDGDPETFQLPSKIYRRNTATLVDNPLLRLDSREVGELARKFARVHGLDYLQDLFEKVALKCFTFESWHEVDLPVKAGKVARDPVAWDTVPSLSREETHALLESNNTAKSGRLQVKSNGFWGQPKQLQITIITLCVAATVQGWNQTGSNSANLNWPSQLGLNDDFNSCSPKGREAWVFAVVNAATYLSASLIGCWLSDPLSESFAGRRAPICLSALLILASVIGGALTATWQQLLACRILLGIGMGCKATMVPVFAAEVSPAHIRGSLVMNWQLFDALGVFLGFTANLILSQTGYNAWRWQTASGLLPTLVLLTLIYVCPESPRFQMKRNRYDKVYETLVLLRGHPILAATELFYVACQMEVEQHSLSQSDPEASIRPVRLRQARRSCLAAYFYKVSQLLTVPRVRHALCASVVCMISQQLCGVNVLVFYSSTLFCDASKSAGNQLQPLWLSWGVGLANFVFAFPAYKLIDSRGRRWLLLVTLPFLALSMLGTGLSFLIPGENSAHVPVISLFTYIFMFFYSWGLGPVPFTISAEVFPLEHRVVGMSFAVFTNLLGAGLLTLFVPALTNAIQQPGLLGIFAFLNVLAFILIFFLVRETAGAASGSAAEPSMISVSLEELNYIFEPKISAHSKYQVKEILPWARRNFWKLLLMRDVEPPPQWYTWRPAEEREKATEMQHVEQSGTDSDETQR